PAIEDQQRTQHLGPCGAALLRRADHDVAGPELESVPACAVVHQGAVPHHERSEDAAATAGGMIHPSRVEVHSEHASGRGPVAALRCALRRDGSLGRGGGREGPGPPPPPADVYGVQLQTVLHSSKALLSASSALSMSL